MKNRTLMLMAALEAFLAAIATPFVVRFADFVAEIETLENRLIEINNSIKNLQAKADAERRTLTTEEETAMEGLFDEFNAVEKDLNRRQTAQEMAARTSAGRGRQTDHNDATRNPGDAGNEGAPQRTIRPLARNGRAATATHASTSDVNRWGFRSFGEFSQCVASAAQKGGNAPMDPRLIANAAPTTGTEGVGADGGFAVPPDFRQEIMEKVAGEDSLLARTDQLTSSSNSISIPKDETTPWQNTGGIQAYWEGEAQQITGSKPALEQSVIRLNSLKALVNVTSELLEDAAALSTYIRRKAPMKIDYKITDGIVNGTGVGMPLGLLNAGCKVQVAKESGQAAASIVFNNIVKMYARVYSRCRANLVWLINQDIEPQLLALQFPGTGTAVPVYLPPGGLSASPYGMLMGKPVIPTEACQTIGTEGDIIAADLSAYMTAQKVSGMRQDTSIHLYFDYDIMAFRFILRVAGQPWWTSAITPANGSNSRSCIVTLASRG
jgi:HK97 family phage major capsid protein